MFLPRRKALDGHCFSKLTLKMFNALIFIVTNLNSRSYLNQISSTVTTKKLVQKSPDPSAPSSSLINLYYSFGRELLRRF